MSLAFLKGLIFGTSPLSSADERRHLLTHSHARASSTDTAVDADVEALNPKAGSASSRRRIDPRVVSDATIGLSDGLTVPFALTAGLSALGDTRVVIYGGFAELIAGALSMGLGGYLGAKSES
ncbi:VIT1/CCC1 transporter family protein [Candidatus Bathyarchaeota archaeon]|nr:VIT1/CCC1 transporter family protein [Candidatus Bathyarchaeota archaeon]